jgi:magnesium transporter
MPRPATRQKQRTPVIRKGRPPGTTPGTLAVDPTALAPHLSVIAYGPGGFESRQIARPDDLDGFVGRWPVVWVSVDGLGDEAVLRALGERFGVHGLALEDVAHVYQRAKVEPYPDHLFVVARMARLDGTALDTEQVSIFVGLGWVLSFQERPGDCFDLVRQRIRDGRGRIREAGAGYLAYALLDALVDAYFPVLETYGDRIEALEAEMLAGAGGQRVGRRIHALRHDLLVLRRAVWPHREALNALLREEFEPVTEEVRIHLRDCYDHTVQLLDILETYREMITGLLDLHLLSVSNRLSEIMKLLTIFAAIFVPLTFITGIYGMNFDHMPELRLRLGYPLVVLLMAAIAGAMLLWFRRRGWLGPRGAGRRRRGERLS